jgi:uncharacterized protein YjiS (DUF1127 family)
MIPLFKTLGRSATASMRAGGLVIRMVGTVRSWRQRKRRESTELHDPMPRDIGPSWVEVYREYSKPFWGI